MTKPSKFVNLHSHTNKSMLDALGEPKEHLDFAVENGMDAMAITDHGSMNSFPHCQEFQDKHKGSFKHIAGVEAYYIPSLADWEVQKKQDEERKAQEKIDKKKVKKESKDDSNQEESDATENEEDSKDLTKWFDPIKRRHHLVLLAKSSTGLKNLFNVVSRSAIDGFYRFPRVDAKSLKENREGIVASTACIAGPLSWELAKEFSSEFRGEDLNASILDDPYKMERAVKVVSNGLEPLIDALGMENVFTELQFNSLPMQHLTNRALMEVSKRNGLTSIVTSDSHYPRPELWLEREMYKMMGYMGKKEFDPELLPKDKTQLKCELFPKNADQIWEAYKFYGSNFDFYDDEFVSRAIQNTWHIAHDIVGDVKADRALKLPKFIVKDPEHMMNHLIQLCIDGLRQKGLNKNKVYIERMKYEFGVIKALGVASYFITDKAIMDIAGQNMLLGVARGSGGASLVCYVLGITQLDPIKYNLDFDRFISLARKGLPDIDCLDENHIVVCKDENKKLSDIKVGDFVLSEGNYEKVTFVKKRNSKQDEVIYDIFIRYGDFVGAYTCSAEHNFFIDGKKTKAKNLRLGNKIKLSNGGFAKITKLTKSIRHVNFVDISVENKHVFYTFPFDCILKKNKIESTHGY